MCVCVCERASERARWRESLLEWHLWTLKNPGSVAAQRGSQPTPGGSDSNMNKSVSRSSPITSRPRVSDRSESLSHVCLVCWCDLCEGVRLARRTDLSHYSNGALWSLRIKGRYLDTICAPVRTSMQPIFTRLHPSGLHMQLNLFQNNVQLLRQQQNTWDIFPRYLPRKEQIITFDPGVLSSLEWL